MNKRFYFFILLPAFPILFLLLNALLEFFPLENANMLVVALLFTAIILFGHFSSYATGSFCALASQSEITPLNMEAISCGEKWLKVSRLSVYILAAVLLTILHLPKMFSSLEFLSVFRDEENLTTLIFLVSILLLLSSYQSFGRLTFRSLPVIALAISVALLFLCFTGKAYDISNLWGLGNFNINTAVISKSISSYQVVIAGSAIVTGVLAVIVFLGKDAFEKYRNHQTLDTTKDTRRRLLTHWHFNPKQLIHDSITWLAIGFALICFIAIMCTIPPESTPTSSNAKDDASAQTSTSTTENPSEPHPSDSVSVPSNTSVDSSLQTTTSTTEKLSESYQSESVSASSNASGNSSAQIPSSTTESGNETSESDSQKQDKEKDKDKDDNNAEEMLLAYLALTATGFAFLGIITHFDISDKSLVASEHLFLLFHSVELYNKEKEISQSRYTDYFQVLANLYSSISPILSENREWHNLIGILQLLFLHGDECQKCIFISRSALAYSLIQDQLSASDKNSNASKQEQEQNVVIYNSGNPTPSVTKGATENGKKTNHERRPIKESEILFALDISTLQYKAIGTNPHSLRAYLSDLDHHLFDNGLRVFIERRLSVSDVSADAYISVVRLDLLQTITQWKAREDCQLKWLCLQNTSCPFFNPNSFDKEKTLHNWKLLALEYPILAFESMEKRLPENEPVDTSSMGSFIKKYYLSLISSQFRPKSDDTELLDKACREFHSFLIRNRNDIFSQALADTMESLEQAELDTSVTYHDRVISIISKYGLEYMSYGNQRASDDAYDEMHGLTRGTLSKCRNLVYLLFAE